MARFTYNCKEHGDFQISLKKREKNRLCPDCGEQSHAIIKVGTFQVMERLDNGAMARAVERLHNIEDIMDDRTKKSSKEAAERMGLDSFDQTEEE